MKPDWINTNFLKGAIRLYKGGVFGEKKEIDKENNISLIKNTFNSARDHLDGKNLSVYIDDNTLIRFLASKSYDLKKAIFNIENYIEWVKIVDLNNLINVPQVVIDKGIYPRAYHGIDIFGRPIYINCIGRSKLYDLLLNYDENNLMNYWIYEYEFLIRVIFPSCVIYMKNNAEKFNDVYFKEETFTIVDLSGLSLNHFNSKCRKIIKELIRISQSYYPELLGEMYVINVPSIFSVIWNFIKPLLDERTSNKISIFTSKCDWKNSLLKKVDREQLPEFLGGNATYGDEWMNKNIGPWSDIKILNEIKINNSELSESFLFSHC